MITYRGHTYRVADVFRDELPDTLYHGTSTAQLARMRDSGYTSQDLYLGEDVGNVCAPYAEQQSEDDGSDAAILVFDTDTLFRLGEFEADVHDAFSGDEEGEIQLGQWIYSGPFQEAILYAYALDTKEEVDLDAFEAAK